ncbi:MAG: DNA helicase RecQ [Planctomycetes bacterium]|nr:DNA helicase RecQ [Planctomycetota bacterium]
MAPTPEAIPDRDGAIRATLQRWFGFSELRPLQREAIDAALDGDDALVVMPTGGGKSLCYQLPALVNDRLTVVVSPLIALMQDQVDGLRLNGIPAAAAHGNLDAAARSELRTMMNSGELRLLFTAPERLFLDGFFGWLCEQDIGAVAIDEAHCISQWGHDFRPEYRRLAELRERLPAVPFHAYTATATPRVRDDIVQELHLREPRVLVGTFDRPELCYRVLPRQDLTAQVADAIGRHPGSAAIVYCISRKDTEALAEALTRRGIDARAYHAGLGAGERTTISADFRAEKLHVVCATVAFGMGIDRSDVRLVVHAAMPKSIEHYQQETGRAGRDGLPAECLLLYSNGDAAKWRTVMQRSSAEVGGDAEALAAQLELLSQMQRFAGLARCRHETLSEYFGQRYAEPEGGSGCGACDVCLDELELVPEATVTAQKILSAVFRTGQRFGRAYVIDVLRGSKNEKVLQRGHDELPTFGVCKDVPAALLGNYVDQLVDQGVLVRSDGEYPILLLGEPARDVLRGEAEVELRVPKAALEARPQRSRRRSGGGRSAGPRQDVELEPAEQELFEAMRALRRQIAGELAVPPYVVFSDATLEDLARARPTSPRAFLRVRGVGEKKLESFGERFLALIAEHGGGAGEVENDAEEDVEPEVHVEVDGEVNAEVEDTAPRTPAAAIVRERAAELFAAGLPLDEVATQLGRARSTVAGYLYEWIERTAPDSVEPWVDAALGDEIVAALEQVGGGRLKPVFEALGGRVGYDDIRIVAAHRRAHGLDGDAEREAEAGSG